MNYENIIEQFFYEFEVKLQGPVVWDGDSLSYIVFTLIQIDENGKQLPSNHTLKIIENKIKHEYSDINIKIIKNNKYYESLTNFLKVDIKRKWKNYIKNMIINIETLNVEVHIIGTFENQDENLLKIENYIKDILNILGFNLKDFIYTPNHNLASEKNCISVIRKKSPIHPKEIIAELKRRNFDVPEDSWLSRILDRWRKRGFIYRKADGKYVMTVEGLRMLGTEASRRSPDVIRALDIYRSKI